MSSSILTTTKKALGLPEDYTAFDPELVMHINSALATLNQIGVGPQQGFMIEDAAATWEEFIGVDPRRNNVKQLVYLKVRLVFDPPGTSFLLTAFQEQIQQLEWRVLVTEESGPIAAPTEIVLDGGQS